MQRKAFARYYYRWVRGQGRNGRPLLSVYRNAVMQADGSTRFVHRYLASVLAQASHRISAEFHVEVKKAGLTVTEWRVLGSLIDGEGETVGRLAELAVTKQPTLSKVLPGLASQGYISLQTARSDRRQTMVTIT